MDRNDNSRGLIAELTLSRLRTQGTRVEGEPLYSRWPLSDDTHSGKPVQVVLACSDLSLRHVIVQELAQDLRTDLVGQAASLREGKRLARAMPADVFLLDLQLADGTALDLIPLIKANQARAEIVVSCATPDDAQALRAFELGATGWLDRSSGFSSFSESVLDVAKGGTVIPPYLVRQLLQQLASTRSIPLLPAAEHSGCLSGRENEILSLVALGLRSRQIGERLKISAETVDAHIKNIYRKLHVQSRAQAVSIASQLGILDTRATARPLAQ